MTASASSRRYFTSMAAVTFTALVLTFFGGRQEVFITIETSRMEWRYVQPDSEEHAVDPRPFLAGTRLDELAFSHFASISAKVTAVRIDSATRQGTSQKPTGPLRIIPADGAALSKAIFSDVFIEHFKTGELPRIVLTASAGTRGFAAAVSGPVEVALARPNPAVPTDEHPVEIECHRCRVEGVDALPTLEGPLTLHLILAPGASVNVHGSDERSVLHVLPREGSLQQERLYIQEMTFCEGRPPVPTPAVTSASVVFGSTGAPLQLIGDKSRAPRSHTLVIEPASSMRLERLEIPDKGAPRFVVDLRGSVNRLALASGCNDRGQSVMPSLKTQLENMPTVAGVLAAMTLVLLSVGNVDKLKRLWSPLGDHK